MKYSDYKTWYNLRIFVVVVDIVTQKKFYFIYYETVIQK